MKALLFVVGLVGIILTDQYGYAAPPPSPVTNNGQQGVPPASAPLDQSNLDDVAKCTICSLKKPDEPFCSAAGPADSGCQCVANSVRGSNARCVRPNICAFKVNSPNVEGDEHPSGNGSTTTLAPSAATSTQNGTNSSPTTLAPGQNVTSTAAPGSSASCPLTPEPGTAYVTNSDTTLSSYTYTVIRSCVNGLSIIFPGPVSGITPTSTQAPNASTVAY